MTDTASDLERVLATYADRAGAGRVDLADLVERRYRRRTRRRGALTAAAMGLALLATVLSTSIVRDGGRPAASGVSSGKTFFVPPRVDPRRSVEEVWPQAVVTVPEHAPDGLPLTIIDALDASHVLVRTDALTLYAYDTVRHSFRTVAGPITGIAHGIRYWAVTPHWVVYGVVTARAGTGRADVYRVPLAGGPPQYVAALPVAETGPLYATDEAVYWSGDGPGVQSLPMSGGTPRPLPGFGEMRIVDASGWAIRFDAGPITYAPALMAEPGVFVTRSLRNVVTGHTVTVTVPPGATWLECAPAYCVGRFGAVNGPIFIVRPDGTGLTRLSGALDGGRLLRVGDHGLVIGASGFVYDPTTGAVGGYWRWAGGAEFASLTVFRTDTTLTLAAGHGPLGTYLMLTEI